jgi:hypothetical protein
MKIYGEITKIEPQDDGTITVVGIASSGAVDDADETVAPEAMKAALPAYMRFGALREMHGMSAAGATLSAEVGDDGATRIQAHVVDPLAVKKVRLGVYKGFSIGGRVLERDPSDRKVITKLKLNEISLVDRPCNPDAVIDVWKAEPSAEQETIMSDATTAPSNAEVIAKAVELARAAGKAGRHTEFVVKAREALMKDRPPPSLDAEDQLFDALDRARAAVKPRAGLVKLVQTPNLAAAGHALAELAGRHWDAPIAKDMSAVARLAEVVGQVAAIQASSAEEEGGEGDGSSVPQHLADAVRQLGSTLIDMAREEVAELLASLDADDVETGLAVGDTDDDSALAQAARFIDLVKADGPMMLRARGRDTGADLAKALAENQRLALSVEAAVPQIDELRQAIEVMQKRLEQVAGEPAAPKAFAGPIRAISKAEDSSPAGEGGQAVLSAEELKKYLVYLKNEGEKLLTWVEQKEPAVATAVAGFVGGAEADMADLAKLGATGLQSAIDSGGADLETLIANYISATGLAANVKDDLKAIDVAGVGTLQTIFSLLVRTSLTKVLAGLAPAAVSVVAAAV